MPELPEVETVVRQLAPVLAGRRVRRLEIFDPRLEPVEKALVAGREVREVFRVGKQVVLELFPPRGGEPVHLGVHLRMTGRLHWLTRGKRWSGKRSHLRACLHLDGGRLIFIDPRRFGVLRLTDSPAELAPRGIDPLTRGFTIRSLERMLATCRQQIKPWLLRQDRLSGVGNIYASEILAAARIGPAAPANTLDPVAVRVLHGAAKRVLRKAIRFCGTTFSDFQDTQGRSGDFQSHLMVYGRESEPCKRCQTPIVRIVQQGRSTFYCPRCQPDE